jgi:hypothetical protein
MTEAEWLACDDPNPMLHFVVGKASDRKARLFAFACCRTVRPTPASIEESRLIGELETHFEQSTGKVGTDYATDLFDRWRRASPDGRTHYWDMFYYLVTASPLHAAHRVSSYSRRFASPHRVDGSSISERDAERRTQSRLLRDIFGNPFRPVSFSPEWRTDTAVSLARQMYESRDFSAMPILADALQDAGCDSAEILGHCRGAGPHVRGCWVVDVVLVKA